MRMAEPIRAQNSASSTGTDSTFVRASSLPRRLGLWSAVAVLVGSTIGSGIFRSPAGIADKLPGPLALLAIAVYSLQMVKGFGWTWNTGGYEYPVFWAIVSLSVAIEAWKAQLVRVPSSAAIGRLKAAA